MQLKATSFCFPSRLLPFFLAVLVLLLFANTRLLWNESYLPIFRQFQTQASAHRSKIEDYLSQVIKDHGLTKQAAWMSCRVQTVPDGKDWSPVTELSFSFHPRDQQLIDTEGYGLPLNAGSDLLKLPMQPSQEPFDASDYLFAVSTTYERLTANNKALLRSWQRWLTKPNGKTNGAHIVVLFDQADNEEILDAEALLTSFGISGVIYTTNDILSKATKYYGLIEELLAFGGVLAATSNTPKKWFTLIEDDIFFPSLTHLDHRLSEYDEEEEVYLGIPSVKNDWIEVQGQMSTYGGGVVILTRKAVETVLSPKCGEPTSLGPPYKSQTWERLVHDCLVKQGNVKMNVLPGNYSPGSKSGRPLVLKTDRNDRVHVGEAHMVADACGEACFRQKYLFRDGWILDNGASISRGSKLKHDERAEEPIVLASQIVLKDEGRARMRLQADEGTWNLVDTTKEDDGSIWQAYARRKAIEDEDLGVLDSIIVLAWNSNRS